MKIMLGVIGVLFLLMVMVPNEPRREPNAAWCSMPYESRRVSWVALMDQSERRRLAEFGARSYWLHVSARMGCQF